MHQKSLDGFAPDIGDDLGFDSSLDSRPLRVQAMPDPRHPNVPNIDVNPAPVLMRGSSQADGMNDQFSEFEDEKYVDDDFQNIKEALDLSVNPNPRIQIPAEKNSEKSVPK